MSVSGALAFSNIEGYVALPTIAFTSKLSLIFWISSLDWSITVMKEPEKPAEAEAAEGAEGAEGTEAAASADGEKAAAEGDKKEGDEKKPAEKKSPEEKK